MKSTNSQLNTAVIKIVPIVKKHIGDFDARVEIWRDGKLYYQTLITYGKETMLEFVDITKKYRARIKKLYENKV